MELKLQKNGRFRLLIDLLPADIALIDRKAMEMNTTRKVYIEEAIRNKCKEIDAVDQAKKAIELGKIKEVKQKTIKAKSTYK